MPPQTLTAQATADATGKATWTFPLVTRGQWWHVAGIVPTAPTAAKFTLRVNGANRFSWLGPLPGAAVVVTQGSSVSITGTGLVALHTYAALLTGSWHVGEAVGVPPQGPSSFSQTAVKITGGTVKITGPVTISGPVTSNVTGGQLTKTGVANQFVTQQFPNSWLGSGADGTVTLSANTTLTRDMQYDALTIDAGVTLFTHGYRVRCRGTVTVKGTITASGSAGATGTATAGGAGGAGAPGGTVGGGYTGGAGGFGATSGAAGTSVATDTLGGGSGGAGGANKTKTGGAGGAGGTAPSAFPTVTTVTDKTIVGGAGAGGGSGGTSATFGGGGGGGGGGGVVLIICTSLVLTGTGTIKANGGNGGAAYLYTTAIGSRGGAGGGGGGGTILILCRAATNITATNVTALGGTPGPYKGTGGYQLPGAPGADGYATVLVTA